MARSPAGAAPRSPSELAARATEVVTRWKERIRSEVLSERRSRSPAKDASAPARLRAELDALEHDIAGIEQTLSEILARAETSEQRAMRAIKAGDDRAARQALTEQQTHAEETTSLEADLTVLRALAAECRFALGMTDDSHAERRGPEAR